MRERLFKNLFTTILGVAILLFCLFMIYQGKQTAEQLSGWMAVGLLFLRSKDSLIGIPPLPQEDKEAESGQEQ